MRLLLVGIVAVIVLARCHSPGRAWRGGVREWRR